MATRSSGNSDVGGLSGHLGNEKRDLLSGTAANGAAPFRIIRPPKTPNRNLLKSTRPTLCRPNISSHRLRISQTTSLVHEINSSNVRQFSVGRQRRVIVYLAAVRFLLKLSADDTLYRGYAPPAPCAARTVLSGDIKSCWVEHSECLHGRGAKHTTLMVLHSLLGPRLGLQSPGRQPGSHYCTLYRPSIRHDFNIALRGALAFDTRTHDDTAFVYYVSTKFQIFSQYSSRCGT